MPTVHFLGKVLPQTSYSTMMSGLPTIRYKSDEGNLDGDIRVQVQESVIDVECIMNRTDSEVLDRKSVV